MIKYTAFFASVIISYNSFALDLDKYTYTIDSDLTAKIQKMPKKDIIVATIDTGLDVKHDYVIGNLYVNNQEFGQNKSANKKDDDSNGLVDDLHGYDFANKTNQITDDHGHGTHIAGLILYPLTGIPSNAKIMPLNYYNPDTESANSNLHNSNQALKYAIEKNVDIINYSGGGSESSNEELRLLKEAEKKRIIIVVAGGNESENITQKPYYPCSYNLSNIICVGNIDNQNELSSSSNYGGNIDSYIIGTKIRSLMPKSRFGNLSGTSQSAAIMSGFISLIKSIRPDLNAQEIKEELKKTGIKKNTTKTIESDRTISSENVQLKIFNPSEFLKNILKIK